MKFLYQHEHLGYLALSILSPFGIFNLFSFLNLRVLTIKLNNFNVLGPHPTFLSTPSVTIGVDGFSYIVGCKYVVEEQTADLATFAYILVNQVNQTIKKKLNGLSRRLNENTFQLPQHIFIAPGKYQCQIEAKSLYNESINSTLSAYIPMPGRISWLLNFV